MSAGMFTGPKALATARRIEALAFFPLLNPSNRKDTRKQLNERHLELLWLSFEYDAYTVIHLFALAMMNGAELKEEHRNALQKALKQGVVGAEEQAQMKQALEEYPNDGSYWTFSGTGSSASGRALTGIESGTTVDILRLRTSLLPKFTAFVRDGQWMEAKDLIKGERPAVNAMLARLIVANKGHPFFDNLAMSTRSLFSVPPDEEKHAFGTAYGSICAMLTLSITVIDGTNTAESYLPSLFKQIFETQLRLLLLFAVYNKEDQKKNHLSALEHVKVGTHALIGASVDLVSLMAANEVPSCQQIASALSKEDLMRGDQKSGLERMAELIYELVPLLAQRRTAPPNRNPVAAFFEEQESEKAIYRLPVQLGSPYPPELHDEYSSWLAVTDPLLRGSDASVMVKFKERYEGEDLACANCGKVRAALSTQNQFKRCGGCRFLAYCTARCAKDHWKASHRQECRKQLMK